MRFVIVPSRPAHGSERTRSATSPFEAIAARSAPVRVAGVLVDVDLAAVRDAGYDTTTIVVVTNTASLGAVVPIIDGEVRAGETIVEIDH